MRTEINASKISNFLKEFNLPEDAVITRKSFGSQIALQEDEEQTCIVKITTNSIDRDGDVLIPEGCDYTDFIKNPVVLWNHQHSSPPIGKISQLQVDKDAIYAKVKFADTPLAKEVWSLVKGGFLKTCSIGFIAKEILVAGTSAFKEYIGKQGLKVTNELRRIVTKYSLIENSIVPLPANQDALILAVANKSLVLDEKLLKELNIEDNKVEQNIIVDKVPEQVKISEPEEAAKPELNEAKDNILQSDIEHVEKEVVKEPDPIWNVLRTGPYKTTNEDKSLAQLMKKGKII